MTSTATPGHATTAAEPTAEWREELAAHLRPDLFPAGQDELQAALIRQRAPSRLLWHLMPLSPSRSYACLEDVLHDLDRPVVSPAVMREPF